MRRLCKKRTKQDGPRGSVILVCGDVEYELITKEISDACELIAIRVVGINIIGIYMRIHIDIPDLINDAMNRAKELRQGNCILMGDFNAKHTQW